MSVLAMRACAVKSAGGGNVRPSPSSDAIVSDFSAISDPLAVASSASGLTLPGSFAASPGGEDEHAVGAEPGGVDERRTLGHATAVTDSLEVTDVGAGVPLVARLGHQ